MIKHDNCKEFNLRYQLGVKKLLHFIHVQQFGRKQVINQTGSKCGPCRRQWRKFRRRDSHDRSFASLAMPYPKGSILVQSMWPTFAGRLDLF